MLFLWAFLGSIAAIIFIALLLLVIMRLGLFALSRTPPPPNMAAAKVVPDCSIPQDRPTLNALNAATTGGVYHARVIDIPAGVQIKLTSSLILVAEERLNVDGIITMDAANVPAGSVVNITLVSLNGEVVIGAQGKVGAWGYKRSYWQPCNATRSCRFWWSSYKWRLC